MALPQSASYLRLYLRLMASRPRLFSNSLSPALHRHCSPLSSLPFSSLTPRFLLFFFFGFFPFKFPGNSARLKTIYHGCLYTCLGLLLLLCLYTWRERFNESHRHSQKKLKGIMAKPRPKLLESSKIGPSKLGFDGEEDNWVFVKKQRVIIVLPSLPLSEHFTLENPETSLSQAELKVDMQEACDAVLTVVIAMFRRAMNKS